MGGIRATGPRRTAPFPYQPPRTAYTTDWPRRGSGGERAARLWGATEAICKATGLRLDVALDIKDYEEWRSVARDRFDSATFTAAWAEGQAMSLEQAIEEAQSLIREPTAPIRKPAISDNGVGKQIPDALWEWIAPLLPPILHHHTGRPRLD